MIKSLIISCFCLLIFSQCGQTQTSNSNNENSNVVTKSTPIPQEFLLGIWKGTEHNTPYPVFLNFKNNNEIEVLNCNTDKKLTLLKYDFYKENEKSAIKISNEEFPLYPWIIDWDELMFDYPDKIDRPWHEYSKRPKLTFYRYKKAEKMSCGEEK